MPDSIWGTSVDNDDVVQAVINTIDYWIDAYLSLKESVKGIADQTIARPRSYNPTFDVDNWVEGQVPQIAVVCAGTVGEQTLRGSGDVSSWFEVHVSAIVTDQTEALTRRVAAIYQSALAMILKQQQQLDGGTGDPFASELTLMEWQIELPDESNRTLISSTVVVHVLISSILNASDGPTTLPTLPSATYYEAETTNLDFDAVPYDQTP